MRSDELALAAVLSAPLFMTARVAIVLRCRYKYGDAVACMRPRCCCTPKHSTQKGITHPPYSPRTTNVVQGQAAY